MRNRIATENPLQSLSRIHRDNVISADPHLNAAQFSDPEEQVMRWTLQVATVSGLMLGICSPPVVAADDAKLDLSVDAALKSLAAMQEKSGAWKLGAIGESPAVASRRAGVGRCPHQQHQRIARTMGNSVTAQSLLVELTRRGIRG